MILFRDAVQCVISRHVDRCVYRRAGSVKVLDPADHKSGSWQPYKQSLTESMKSLNDGLRIEELRAVQG